MADDFLLVFHLFLELGILWPLPPIDGQKQIFFMQGAMAFLHVTFSLDGKNLSTSPSWL